MSTTGYSGTPLYRKLGIKEGYRVRTLGAPANLSKFLTDLPSGVVVTPRKGQCNIVLLFATTKAQLATRLPKAMAGIDSDGAIWTAWPKKASKVPTEIDDPYLRMAILPHTPLVDNKVCALSEVWSGLRWVVRLEHRNGWDER